MTRALIRAAPAAAPRALWRLRDALLFAATILTGALSRLRVRASGDEGRRSLPGDDIVPGIRALDTAGHTPGHLSFEVTGGEGLLIAVDVANNEVVSFEHPDWPFGYDTLPDIAIKTRRALLDRAAADRTKLLGYHWAYPGVGYAVRRADAFAFTPATR